MQRAELKAAKAASYWFSARQIATITSVQPGFSGGQVFRIDLASGERFALKSWPSGTEKGRVAKIHDTQLYAHRRCGWIPRLISCPLVNTSPKSTTYIELDNLVWEVSSWIDGFTVDQLIDSNVTSSEGLSRAAHSTLLDAAYEGASAIAGFHHCTQSILANPQPSSGVSKRFRRLDEIWYIAERIPRNQISHIANDRLRVSLHEALQLFEVVWPSSREHFRKSLHEWLDRRLTKQIILRDLHREHMLFRREPELKVVGMIDFDAVCVDSVAFDLARWVGSIIERAKEIASHVGGISAPNSIGRDCFGWSSQELWNSALDGYRETASFSEEQELLARDIFPVSAWISLANWLDWVLVERREFRASVNKIARRIESLNRVVALQNTDRL